MIMPIDRGSPVPLYQQLAAILREQIAGGARMLPSIKRLAAEYELAEVTVRKALDVLRAEGLISGVSGKGTYVTER